MNLIAVVDTKSQAIISFRCFPCVPTNILRSHVVATIRDAREMSLLQQSSDCLTLVYPHSLT